CRGVSGGVAARIARPEPIQWTDLVSAARSDRPVRVRRQLAGRQRDSFGAASLADNETGALMDRDTAAQIRQAESLLSVAAIGGSNQIEQGIILRDGH